MGFNKYDIPYNKFYWAADTWLQIREKKTDGDMSLYAGGGESLKAAIRAVFYGFHSFMNNEISFEFQQAYIAGKFEKLAEDGFRKIDLGNIFHEATRTVDKKRPCAIQLV